MSVKIRCSMALFALIAMTAGCQDNKPSNHYEGAGTQGSVAVVNNDIVILDLPTIRISSGVTYISGSIHRRPGVNGELPGRVDIEFLGPEGEYLDGLPALLTPRAVPVDPNSAATYSTSYGYVPPSGSIVRVHFVDRETQIQEDLEANGYGYGGKAGAEGGKNGGHKSEAGRTSGSYGTGMGNMGSHW